MQRIIGKIGLLFISVGAMIGSGWLFGPLYAAQIAGPASILAWPLGGLLVFIIALSFAELATTFPVTGGIARFPQFSHGPLVSFTMTWIAWLAYALLPPIEVQALLQYSSTHFPWLIHEKAGNQGLSGYGFVVATVLLLFMSVLNIYGIKLVSRFNVVLVVAKILVPLLTGFTLLFSAAHFANLHQYGGFMPSGLKGLVTALPAAGVVFSFFGFRLAIEVAGEAKNPQRSLPIALLGSLVICIVLYTFVQFAFVSVIPGNLLAQGWQALAFSGDAGPLVGMSAAFGLTWLVLILYCDAIYSPFGSALIVVTSTARLDYAMAVNKYVPKFLTKLNSRGVPYLAILVNFITGMILLLPFPGWQKLASFILSALVVSHAIAPITLVALRKQLPNINRPFRLPYATALCLLSFFILNLIAYWTGWATLSKMYLAGLIGFIVLFVYRAFQGADKPILHWRNAWWLIPYFAGMAIISYLGSFGGGKEVITFGWDFVVLAVFSIVIFYFAVKARLPTKIAALQVAQEHALLPFLHSDQDALDLTKPHPIHSDDIILAIDDD